MTIQHHPSDESLARHAAGILPAGPNLVVAVHIAGCPDCLTGTAVFEEVGGALLEALAPSPLAPDALDRAFAGLDEHVRPPAPGRPAFAARRRGKEPPPLPEGMVLPEPLRGCEIGPWRRLGPSVRWSRIVLPRDPDATVVLVGIGANRRLPAHGHTGTEFNQVLYGSFSDQRGCYAPGDLMEADSEVEHRPVVGPNGECICLAAVEGSLKFHGWLGQLLRPFVGA